MNWLAHFVLSPDDDRVRLGNWLPDVLSRDELARFDDPGIRHGIELHRLIDRLTDSHPAVGQARVHLPTGLRRFAGIVLDVTWDHFLARDFAALTGRELDPFVTTVEAGLARQQMLLSPEVNEVVARMAREGWLRCYGTTAGVELTLTRIARRLSSRARARFVPAAARRALEQGYPHLEAAFGILWRDLTEQVEPELRRP